MKLPNGYGSVYKLSGNRRNPWVACVTTGYNKETRNQERRVIGYFSNKPKALNALADYNQNPFDVDSARRTFQKFMNFGTRSSSPKTQIRTPKDSIMRHTNNAQCYTIARCPI